MNERPFTDRPLNVAEAAEFLDVSTKTVRRLLDAGELQEQERDSKNRIIIRQDSLNAVAERLAHERGDAQTEANIVLASQAAIMDRALQRHAEVEKTYQATITDLTDKIARLETERQYMVSNEAKIAYEREIAALQAELKVTQEKSAPKGFWARLLGR